MDITLSNDRKPIGTLTWIAHFRDGTELAEFGAADSEGNLPDQVSFDRVSERDDVDEVVLLHVMPNTLQAIHIRVQPGEHVWKKWIRTHTITIEGKQSDHELPVIDAFTLQTEKPVHYYVYHTGDMLITSETEPPF